MKPGAGGVPSDTPRTDEALKWCRDSGYCVSGEIGDLSRTLETEAAQLRAERDALAVALRLPFLWEEAFNVSAASSDNVLDQHGWDGKSAPDEFMHEYARKALSQHGGNNG